MKTNNFWKSLLMSAALLVSAAMVSCEKDQEGHPVDFDAQITASPEKIVANLGETITITVVSNTDWVLEPTTHRLLIDDCDAYVGETGTTQVHIKLVPFGDERLEDDGWKPGSILKLDFRATGYVQGLKFTRHAYVDVQVGEAEVNDGTVDSPLSVAEAIAKAVEAGSNSDDATGPYYIKGIVSKVATTFAGSGSFGNANFYIKDDLSDSSDFYAYQVYYLEHKQWVSGWNDVEVGDEVIICGKVYYYQGNTPETVGKGDGYIYSHNGETTVSDIGNGGDGGNESADVTLPYTLDTTGSLQGSSNAYAGTALATVNDITWAFEGNSQINPWRLGGKSITNTGRAVYTKTAMNADVKAIELTHGTANDITVNSLTVIVSKNSDFSEPVSTLTPAFEANATTTIEKPAGADWNGCYYKFVYNVTVTNADQNKFVQFNKVVFTDGNGGGTTEPEPETPSEAKAVTVAEFNAAEESETQVYQLTGVVSGSINTTYGNFDLVDETGSVYVYGLSTGEQSWGSKTDQTFSSMGIGAGDKIKINGYRGSYNGKIEVMYAWLVEIVEKASGEEPGTGGGDTPAVGDFGSDAIFVCSKDDSTNSSYTLGASTFNGEAATGFKLGTASKVGKFTSEAVGVTGDYTLSLYGVAWKGQSGTLKVSVNGGGSVESAASYDLKSNDGASGNAPYTVNVTEGDHYTFSLKGLTANSTITFETEANAYRVIVAGIHLEK